MKNLFLIVSVILSSSLILVSCSKKEDEPPTVKQLLQGKWNDVKYVTDILINGEHNVDTSYATPGEYTQFGADTVTFGDLDGPYQQLRYFLVGNDKIVFDLNFELDTFDIINLTSTDLLLRDFYEESGNPVIDDWYLKR